MSSRHIRHLATELSARLFDREFLRSSGLTRRTMQTIFDREKWERIFEKTLPASKRFQCGEILEFCIPEMERLSEGQTPEEGWISYGYKYSTHILYPDEEFSENAALFAPAIRFFLQILQLFFDED